MGRDGKPHEARADAWGVMMRISLILKMTRTLRAESQPLRSRLYIELLLILIAFHLRRDMMMPTGDACRRAPQSHYLHFDAITRAARDNFASTCSLHRRCTAALPPRPHFSSRFREGP